jgi:signal transduction histidine kinase
VVAVDRKKAAPRKRSKPVRRETDAARVRRRFEQLLEAGLTIYQEHTLPAVLQRIVDAAREVVGARYAALAVLDREPGGTRVFVTSGVTPAEASRIGDPPSGRGLIGLVMRERRPVRTANIKRHPASAGFPPHHPAMSSFLGVPVALRDRVFGNLYLTEKHGGRSFSAEDEMIAVLLAAQAAAAIDNARLHEEGRELLGQVQAMQRQRDLFFAMMNHELRNALTGVFGWAERLVRRRPGDPTQAAREVFEGAERTITLLNNFLDLTRLDAGKLRPVWRDVQVRTAVARAVAGLIPSAEPKQVSIEEQYVNEPRELRTDPMRLEQILVNLVSNAIRHSPEGRAVVIRVQGNRDDAVFEVEDRGPGVPAELREKIFEPFERFDPMSGTGSGLGLPLSRRLAEILGGHLTMEAPDGITVFRLVLPLAPPADV